MQQKASAGVVSSSPVRHPIEASPATKGQPANDRAEPPRPPLRRVKVGRFDDL